MRQFVIQCELSVEDREGNFVAEAAIAVGCMLPGRGSKCHYHWRLFGPFYLPFYIKVVVWADVGQQN